MDAMYNAVDIVLNEADAFVPLAKVASFGYGLAVTSVKLTKFYDAFKKVKSLGDDVAYKLYIALRNKIDDMYSNFEWAGSDIGAMVSNFGDPLGIWDDLISIFNPYSITGGNGSEIVANFALGGSNFELKFYPNSTTPPHCPTVSIRKLSGGTFTFKMRFCD